MPEFIAHRFSTLRSLLGSQKESMLNLLGRLKIPQYKAGIYLYCNALCIILQIAALSFAGLAAPAICSHPHDFQQWANLKVQQPLSPLDLSGCEEIPAVGYPLRPA